MSMQIIGIKQEISSSWKQFAFKKGKEKQEERSVNPKTGLLYSEVMWLS